MQTNVCSASYGYEQLYGFMLKMTSAALHGTWQTGLLCFYADKCRHCLVRIVIFAHMQVVKSAWHLAIRIVCTTYADKRFLCFIQTEIKTIAQF
jgi:hypothetical protein